MTKQEKIDRLSKAVSKERKRAMIAEKKAGIYQRAFEMLREDIIPEMVQNAKRLGRFPGQKHEARARHWATEIVTDALQTAALEAVFKELTE